VSEGSKNVQWDSTCGQWFPSKSMKNSWFHRDVHVCGVQNRHCFLNAPEIS